MSNKEQFSKKHPIVKYLLAGATIFICSAITMLATDVIFWRFVGVGITAGLTELVYTKSEDWFAKK